MNKPTKKETAEQNAQAVTITPPNWVDAYLDVASTSPLVFNKFSARAQTLMTEKQEAGQAGHNRRKREPKDFDKIWPETVHYSEEGWHGFPCACIRNAMIEACKTVGFKMTIAKLSIFVEADGLDRSDGQPLVRMNGDKPERFDAPVRLATGTTDIATRGRVRNWTARVRIRWDADQFSANDVANLLARAGSQVGIGAGRPGSKMSTGMGWGTFRLA